MEEDVEVSPTESDDDSDADMDGPMYKPVVTLGCWDAASQWEDLHPSGALLLGCALGCIRDAAEKKKT